MDKATFIGVVIGFICVLIPILTGGYPIAFFDLASLLLVVGGGIASTLISYRLSELTKVSRVVANAFWGKQQSDADTINLLLQLSIKARKEGLLSLESELDNLNDNFLTEFLQLVIDGVTPEVLSDAMDLELTNLQARHERGQSVFKTMGMFFPAWGMIGTLMGLISLLKSLDDPSKIGPSMALALVTTFYGSVLANLVCLPIANKLAIKSKEEMRKKEMLVMGLISIQEGENPKIMEQKLKTFLSNEKKKQYEEAKAISQER